MNFSFRVTLLLLSFYSTTVQAQICPAPIHPRDRKVVREEVMAPVLLQLTGMHELGLQVAADQTFSLNQISAINDSYHTSLDRLYDTLGNGSGSLHWRTQLWLRRIAADEFSNLATSQLSGESAIEARANAVAATRLVNSAITRIARCFLS